MCGTGTVTGGGAKHVGEWRAGAEATTVGSAVAVRLLHRDDARRQKAAAQDIVSKRRGSIRALAQDQEPGSASGETRGGPTHGDKEFKQKRLAL
jgi:hypothetical protein